jgi:hypothetical protein
VVAYTCHPSDGGKHKIGRAGLGWAVSDTLGLVEWLKL